MMSHLSLFFFLIIILCVFLFQHLTEVAKYRCSVIVFSVILNINLSVCFRYTFLNSVLTTCKLSLNCSIVFL